MAFGVLDVDREVFWLVGVVVFVPDRAALGGETDMPNRPYAGCKGLLSVDVADEPEAEPIEVEGLAPNAPLGREESVPDPREMKRLGEGPLVVIVAAGPDVELAVVEDEGRALVAVVFVAVFSRA